MTESFAPSVRMPDGHTVVPAGWMWVLGFALADCDWAIRKADTEDFKNIMRQWAEEQKQERLVAEIESCERRITELRKELKL